MQTNKNFEQICKLPSEKIGVEILIKTSWGDKSFSAIIIDERSGWSGNMTEDDAANFSKQLGLTTEQYISECNSALTTNGGCNGFEYMINKDKFQWKKIGLEMKITFGYIQLNPVPVVESLHNMLSLSINTTCSLENKISKLQDNMTELEKDNTDLLKKIDECASLKNKMETELYSQFLVILNAKKKRIVELQQNRMTTEDMSSNKDELEKYYNCETDVDSDSSESDNQEVQSTSNISGIDPRNMPSTSKEPDQPEVSCLFPQRRSKRSNGAVEPSTMQIHDKKFTDSSSESKIGSEPDKIKKRKGGGNQSVDKNDSSSNEMNELHNEKKLVFSKGLVSKKESLVIDMDHDKCLGNRSLPDSGPSGNKISKISNSVCNDTLLMNKVSPVKRNEEFIYKKDSNRETAANSSKNSSCDSILEKLCGDFTMASQTIPEKEISSKKGNIIQCPEKVDVEVKTSLNQPNSEKNLEDLLLGLIA